jgi:hypothetical protein
VVAEEKLPGPARDGKLADGNLYANPDNARLHGETPALTSLDKPFDLRDRDLLHVATS